MAETARNQEGDLNGRSNGSSVSDELKLECEKLRELAEKLKTQERSWSEIEANYPHFRQYVYAKVREHFARTVEELPDKNLETYAAELGAQPLQSVLDELKRMDAGA
jgi:hypothetical protein